MIWMIQQISIYILCYLFICLLIGSILFLIWKMLCKKMEEKGFVRLNYGLLKIVILFFLIPFPIVILRTVLWDGVSTYLRRLEKKDFIETKKEGRRSFIYSKVDESDYHKVQFEQMKKVWFDDSWDEFSVALSDVVKQEENDKLRRLIDDLDDSAD